MHDAGIDRNTKVGKNNQKNTKTKMKTMKKEEMNGATNEGMSFPKMLNRRV